MKETTPSPESQGEIKREDVLAAFKPFVERGIRSPDDLDLDDPEVAKAHALFEAWSEQEEAKIEAEMGDEDDEETEEEKKLNISRTMFHVDAGFTDPDYLEEVLEWLMDDSQEGEEDDEGTLSGTDPLYVPAIEKVKALLGQAKK